MDENLKEIIINDFELYVKENEKEFNNMDFFKVVSLYIASLYYDIVDELENNRETFRIDKDLSDFDAITEIEDIITDVIIKNEF